MSFKINSLYLTDGYKVGHKAMLAPGTTKLYGTWIPRSVKHAPKGITKIVSFGQQLVWKWLHDEFEENFFFTKLREGYKEIGVNTYKLELQLKQIALQFVKDMSLYLGMEYNGKHFEELWDLGYLPIKVKALPEGIETNPNIPHMTFINTIDGFAWLTLYLETIVSSLAWKPATAATIAKLYRRQAEEWVAKTDPANMWLVDFMCHDFSARGLDPMSQYLIGLGHATSFKGSDTLPVIPASRYRLES
jgi:nicotinamide phosphoribosyltransferase